MPSFRRDKHVNVVWHHHPGSQLVSLTIKVLESLSDNRGGFRLREGARAVTLIEPSLNWNTETGVILALLLLTPWLGMRSKPSITFLFNVCQLVRRDRISKAKRDKIGNAVLPPMRQTTS